MRRIFCKIISAFLLLLAVQVFSVFGQDDQKPKKWIGSFSDGKLITKDMLKTILSDHEKWLYKKDGGKKADLSGAHLFHADLNKAKLSGAHLSGAHLSGAYLSQADLSGANLFNADLSGANLSRANLSGARLLSADLNKAKLNEANLSGVDLRGANLSGANLSGTDLSNASLSQADLSQADLRHAKLRDVRLTRADLNEALVWECDFSQTKFELKSNALPYIPSIATAVGLSKMTYQRSVHSLVELRKSFKEIGFRRQEREITYAIKRTQRHNLWNDENSNLLPEFCTIDLTEGGYHLGTFAIMGVTKPTHKSRRYPDGKIQEIKFPEKPQP